MTLFTLPVFIACNFASLAVGAAVGVFGLLAFIMRKSEDESEWKK